MWSSSTRHAFALIAAGVLAGCVGELRAPSPAPGEGTDATTPTMVGEPPPAPCTAIPPAPMRRLSRAEYQATVRDLFASVQLPALTIPRDATDHGFENRADLLNPSPLLIEQYNAAAVAIAAKVIATPSAVLPCTPTATTQAACEAQFISTFGGRVFRRPLTGDELATYTQLFDSEVSAGSGFNSAVQLTVETMLQAPQFLYRLEFGAPDPAVQGQAQLTDYEIATRMAYLLWGSTPDAALLDAASAGRLADPSARETEARRMLMDTRAKDMLVEFHRQWLDFDQLSNEPKDTATFPAYQPALQAAIREESDRFVADVMWSGDGSLRSLLTSTQTQVNAPLAGLYGVTAPASGWAKVTLAANERSGLLTRANFLASRAHRVAGSPPLRAVYVLRRFLCQEPQPPPATANTSEPTQPTGTQAMTNRQLYQQRLAPATCAACHSTFTDLGYALEGYDAIGQYRTTDNGLPVDTTGHFKNAGLDWSLSSGIDLSAQLGDAPQAQTCMTRNWFAYAAGRAAEAGDRCQLESMTTAMAAAGGNVREALVALVARDDFAVRPVVQP